MTLQLVKDLPAEIAAMPVKINQCQRGKMRPAINCPADESRAWQGMPDSNLTAQQVMEALRRMASF